MGLVGRNGAGKTTIIKAILNMIRLSGGSVAVFGQDHLQAEREIKARIGVVMDYTFFVESWTLNAVERAVAPFYPAWDTEAYWKLLKKFSLNPSSKFGDLSRGMKMKLTTAVALSHGPDLLILDEPTSGLDPVVRDELLEILHNYMSGGNRGVLFSTHITSDLEKIADYITFIDDGRIMATRPADDFLLVHSALNSVVLKNGDSSSIINIPSKALSGYNYCFWGKTWAKRNLKSFPSAGWASSA